jgi:hypothetical protein
MFEDINNSGDGGVYAELVQNRAFQGSSIFPSTLYYWHSIGGTHLALKNLSNPLSDALPTSMQVRGGDEDEIGFWNEGIHPIALLWTCVELTMVKASGGSQSKQIGATMARSTSMGDLTAVSRSLWCLIQQETLTQRRRLTLRQRATHGHSTNTLSSPHQMLRTATIRYNSRCQLQVLKAH